MYTYKQEHEVESAKFKGNAKTEVKGCGKAMSRDKLPQCHGIIHPTSLSLHQIQTLKEKFINL
jgi:hypothetical protein